MRKNNTECIKKHPAKRLLCILLVTIFMMPLFSNLLHILPARAASEFELFLDWVSVSSVNNMPHAFSADRRTLELTPAVNSNYPNETGQTAVSPYSVRMMARVSPPDGIDALPDEIEIRIPMYIFTARPQSSWASPPTDEQLYIVNTTLDNSRGYHEIGPQPGLDAEGNYLQGDQTGLYSYIDLETHEYVFRNWKHLTGGSTTVVNIDYRFIPDKIQNGFNNDEIAVNAKFMPNGEITPENTKTSAPLTVKLNTFVAPPFRFEVRQYRAGEELFKYESWQTSPNWGTKPAGSVFTGLDIDEIYLGDGKYVSIDDIGKERYYYLIWEIRYQRRANRSTQPHEVNIDIELGEDGGGEIVCISGADVLSSDANYQGTVAVPFVGQNASQLAAASATILSPTTARINLTHTPSAQDARSDYPQNTLRWVLVRYPRGEGPGYGYNVETDMKATLTLTGIDEMGDANEGKDSDPGENAKWESDDLGNAGVRPSPLTYTTGGTAGRGRYVDDPKYTHAVSSTGPAYEYIPVTHSAGGLGYRTLKYQIANYANNNAFTLYSAINRLSEGSVTNPVSVPMLRMPNEASSFRLRAEAEGYHLTRGDESIPGIDYYDPKNYYQKDYTVEIIDGMTYLRDVLLAKEDYSVTKSYVTYTEYIETFNPNNGRLSALTSTNYSGSNPAAGKPYDKGYSPVEVWYRTVFNDEWAKAGEVMKTASTNAGVVDITYGTYGTYIFTTTDGTQLQNPSAPMNASNQLIFPKGTYEVKYVHTSSRFRVDVTPYITVEVNSTPRVRALLDGGLVNGTAYSAVNSAVFRNIHSMAVKDSTGNVRNFVPVGSAFTSSWSGATGVETPSAFYQAELQRRSTELYPETPATQTVMQNYTYMTLNRTSATTSFTKVNTGTMKNGGRTDNTVSNDSINGLRYINQELRVYDEIIFNPLLVPGKEREDKLADLADSRIFRMLTEGTFYDLLPPGTYIDGAVEAYTYHFDPWTDNSAYAAAAADANNANRLNAMVNYYMIDNWQGSGRTMLVVNVKAPNASNYQLYGATRNTTWVPPSGGEPYLAQDVNNSALLRRIEPNDAGYERVRSGFVVNYTLVTTYQNIFDRSDNAGNFNAYNVAAYRNRNNEKLGNGGTLAGGTTVATAAPWSYNVSGAFTSTGAISTAAPTTRTFFTHLEVEPSGGGATRPQDDGNRDTVYASSNTIFPSPSAYTYGVSKHVRSQSDPDFVAEAETIPGGIYQYQLHFLSAPINVFSHIMIYDILENDAMSEWKGTLIDVDTSYARSQGCAPVVYYSTIPADDLLLIEDKGGGVFELSEQADFAAVIGDDDIWTTDIPADRSSITAVAIDFSKDSSGNDFKLVKGDAIFAVVNMRAPTDASEYDPIITGGLRAVNRIGYFTVETDSYNASSFREEVRWSEQTRVTMRDIEFDFVKNAVPASGTSSDAQAVDRGDTIEYTLAVQNTDPLPARNVTVVDSLPGGVTLDTAAIKYYAGTDATKAAALPSGITLERTWADDQLPEAEGQIESVDGRKLTFIITEMNAHQTINLVLPVKVDGDLEFGTPIVNTADVLSINGAEYAISGGTTYHQVYPLVALGGTASLANRYQRAGEFEFVLTDEDDNIISKAGTDQYGNFVFPPLGFKDEGTYTYTMSELPDTVPTGNLPSGRPGVVEYDSRTYTVTIVVTKDALTGEMATEVSYECGGELIAGEALFENAYIPEPVYLPLEINKVLTGRSLLADEFSFIVTDVTAGSANYGEPVAVYDADEALIGTEIGSTASGLIGFKLRFDEEGTYTFEVREAIPDVGDGRLDNVEYDASVYTVTVTVGKTSIDPLSTPTPTNAIQRNDGRLSIDTLAKITIGSGDGIRDALLSFTNKFTPKPVSAQITGTKILTGGKPLAEEMFVLELWDVTDPQDAKLVEGNVTHDIDGKITFSEIVYTDIDAGAYGKTFIYEIREVIPTERDNNITYSSPITVQVRIGIDRDKGELSSTVIGQGFIMTNVFTPDGVVVELDVSKVLYGRDITAGQFVFDLINETNPDPDYHTRVERRTNDATGKIPFNSLTYTASSSTPYLYRIEEVVGVDDKSRVNYDRSVFHISVSVTQDALTGDLSASAAVITHSDAGEPLVFHNTAIHDIVFMRNDADETVHSEHKAEHNESLGSDAPEDPAHVGRIFRGWNTEPDGSGQSFDDATIITSDTTYYAIWEKIGYTVTFDGNGGTPAEREVSGFYYEDSFDSVSMPLPDEPMKQGYIFTGWATETSGGGVFDEDTLIVGDIKVYAQWTPISYTVIYAQGDYGAWVIDDPESPWYIYEGLHYGDAMPARPATMTSLDPSWHFAKWDIIPSDIITADVVYTALWVNEPDEYMVSFHPGEQGLFTTEHQSGLFYENPMPYPTMAPFGEVPPGTTGWAFEGWLPVVDGIPIGPAVFDFESITVTAHIDYIAQWSMDTNTYSITYSPGEGGNWNAAEEEAYTFTGLQYGEPTPLPPSEPPAKPGWAFIGWSPGISSVVTGTALYEAQWELLPPPPQPPPVWRPPQGTNDDPDDDKDEEIDDSTPQDDDSLHDDQYHEDIPQDLEVPFESEIPQDDESLHNNVLDDEEYLQLPEEPEADLPQDFTMKPPENIILPEGTEPKDYLSIDLQAKQPDQSQPGGTMQTAPPVANDDGYLLFLQVDENGNVSFLELIDPDSPPLGIWIWNEELGVWTFTPYESSAIEMPKTGRNAIGMFLFPAGLILAGLGLWNNRRRRCN